MLTLFAIIFLASAAGFAADNDSIIIGGRVKDELWKQDLTDARVVLFDKDGNPRDSIICDKGYAYRNGEIKTTSRFYFFAPRVDSTYVFDVVCPGYETQTITQEVRDLGKRQNRVEVPMIFLKRAPRQLNDVTVGHDAGPLFLAQEFGQLHIGHLQRRADRPHRPGHRGHLQRRLRAEPRSSGQPQPVAQQFRPQRR